AMSSVTVQPITPEGLILASIDLPQPSPIEIFDNSTLLATASTETSSYPFPLLPGHHVISVRFNNIEESREIDLKEGEHRLLVFMFPRTDFPLSQSIDQANIQGFKSSTHDLVAPLEGGNSFYDPYDSLWHFLLYGTVSPTSPVPVDVTVNQD